MITLQTETFEITSEPRLVVVSLLDTNTQITVRSCMTPDQAHRLAAQIMMEADKAESGTREVYA